MPNMTSGDNIWESFDEEKVDDRKLWMKTKPRKEKSWWRQKVDNCHPTFLEKNTQ